MPKVKLNDILKGGNTFQITDIDAHIDEFNKMMESIKTEQVKIKKLKKNKKFNI